MANASEFTAINGDMSLGARAQSMVIVSTIINRCVILAALAVMNASKANDLYQIGVPNAGVLVSGGEISPVKQKQILEYDNYEPLEFAVNQQDVKRMALRDTNPKISNGTGGTVTLTIGSGTITSASVSSSSDFTGVPPTIRVDDIGGGQGAILRATNTSGSIDSITVVAAGSGYSTNSTATVVTGISAGQKFQRPYFRWTHWKSPGLVYHHDEDRYRAMAGSNEELFNAGINDLYSSESMKLITNQTVLLNEEFIYGLPTDDTQSIWDYQYGFLYAIDDGSGSNARYAGCDRSLVANAYWRGKKDTTAHVFTLVDLWQDMHITKGLTQNSKGIDACFVSPVLFAKFQKESLAYQLNVNTDPMMQKLRATFGYEGMVLKYQNTYFFMEPKLGPKVVVGINTESWIVAFKSGKKFNITGPFDQAEVEGGKDANLIFSELQFMIICEAPNLQNCQFSKCRLN